MRYREYGPIQMGHNHPLSIVPGTDGSEINCQLLRIVLGGHPKPLRTFALAESIFRHTAVLQLRTCCALLIPAPAQSSLTVVSRAELPVTSACFTSFLLYKTL
jgi:hypothetical protein